MTIFYGADGNFVSLGVGFFSNPISSPCISIPNNSKDVFIDFFYFIDESVNNASIDVTIFNVNNTFDQSTFTVQGNSQVEGSPFRRAIVQNQPIQRKNNNRQFRRTILLIVGKSNSDRRSSYL